MRWQTRRSAGLQACLTADLRVCTTPVLLSVLATAGCLRQPARDPGVIVVGVVSAPNNLDPRVGTDAVSQNAHQLIFNGLVRIDEHLKVVPDVAERLDNPEPTVYIATLRKGVLFHDGRELTSADVVYTFRSIFDPTFPNPYRGALRMLKSVDARDRYTVVFTLTQPFGSFPVNLVFPMIVPDGAGHSFNTHPIGTGPYRFVRNVTDERVELAAFDQYFGGAPSNRGVVLKVIPDNIMAGLELRKGVTDVVVNDLPPDIVYQLERDPKLRTERSPGTDYQYIGFNMRDPILKDVRVRRALSHAIDRHAIIEYMRRGLAVRAVGILPPESWAFNPDVPVFDYDPEKARALLDEAGYPDPDGDGPATRMHLTLKTSTGEFFRLQATVIQQQLQAVGVDLEIRTYEFATLYADVLSGNFQMYSLQWVGGAVVDPDILRRVFHSNQVPPAGFNRGHFSDPQVDHALDEASRSTDETERRRLFGEAQRLIAEQVPYISLWCKTNAVVAQRDLSNVRVSPTVDFNFLKDVARRSE
jgi:peptide/nickel transport system substrate-binding protein